VFSPFHPILSSSPLVHRLANKQDLEGALPAEDVATAFGLDASSINSSFSVVAGCARKVVDGKVGSQIERGA
jgi:hypothetical protein